MVCLSGLTWPLRVLEARRRRWAAVVWWRESCCSHCPLAEEREGGDTEGEEGAPKAGAVRLAGRVGGEMARPGGDDALALGGVVDEAGEEGRSG